jgi:hypothetical protein
MADTEETPQTRPNDLSAGNSCTPPPPLGPIEIRERRAAHERLVAWRKRQRDDQTADPRLSKWLLNAVAQRVSGVKLLNHGVDVVLHGFAPGTQVEAVANYPQIVRAFSRTFGPNLFDELMLSDPFP